MAPPQFLLDALTDSISSGTFIDTKFYVFSRRDCDSGRVGSPRALYCNSSVLNAVPYLASLFSGGFSEGQMRDINDGFPSRSRPHVEDYEYLSDSDLEDVWSFSEDEEEPHAGGCGPNKNQDNTHAQTLPADALNRPPLPSSSVGASGEPQNDMNPSHCLFDIRHLTRPIRSSDNESSRMGKVAVIRDIGAITFEAMLYFLYTGEINFAPLSSDSRWELSERSRTGDWSTGRLPSPSAKSVFRLADKYDMPALRAQAKAHILNNLEHCDVVEEVFSSFTYFFPEIMSTQVSILVTRMSEESESRKDGVTRKLLQEKIASLSQPQLRRAADALSMIWSFVIGPLKPPAAQPARFTPSVTSIFPPNWCRVKLAFLKSISTGTFIDTQYYAFSKTHNELPFDAKPLFISSMVIEEWGPAITAHTVRVGPRAVCLVDGPMDDYDSFDRETVSPEVIRERKVLKYWTEAVDNETCEGVLLMSGAWKTWVSLLSCSYKGRMCLSGLPASKSEGNLVKKERRPQPCSPRSMYALAATLGIENVKSATFKYIRSKLSSSNIVQELFSSFTASHQEVMEMEIEALDNFIGKDPKLLMDHIRSVASGEVSFFPITLSLVYDKLIGKAFQKDSPHPHPEDRRSISNPFRASSPAPASTLVPFSSTTPSNSLKNEKWLECIRCGRCARLGELYDGLHCPRCPEKGRNGQGKAGRPFMVCLGCRILRTTRACTCIGVKCGARFW